MPFELSYTRTRQHLPCFIVYNCVCTAEKATEILREVKGAQEAFRKQKDLHKLEAEVHIIYHGLYHSVLGKEKHPLPLRLLYILL